jgi:hypothetical protein
VRLDVHSAKVADLTVEEIRVGDQFRDSEADRSEDSAGDFSPSN